MNQYARIRKKQIIHVLGIKSRYGGNIIASLIQLAEKLKESDTELSFVFPYEAKNSEWCKKLSVKYKVFFIPSKQFSIKTFIALRRIFRELKPDIIHTHHDYYDICATLAANRKAKVIWHFRNSTVFLSQDLPRKIKKRIHYGLISRKVWLISVAEYYRQVVINKGFSDKRSKTILNGIDLQRLNSGEVGNRSLKQCNNKNILLGFGYPIQVKGTDIILTACEILEKKGIDFELWIVFSETAEKEIINQRYELGFPNWLKIKEPLEDIQYYYREANVFISASRYETFSFSVAEATYSGLPVISSNIPGLEWAHNLPSVTFFESENPYQLSSVIENVLKADENSIQREIKSSKEYIKKNLSIQVWIKNIVDFYESIL